jgi:hypothetical protein
MVKRCSVCNHPSRLQIDHGLVTGVPYRNLAGQFGLSPSALCRHRKHLARASEAQRRQEDHSYQAAVLDRLDLLSVRLDRLFNAATGDYRSPFVALGCIRESIRLLSLQERVRHGLGP